MTMTRHWVFFVPDSSGHKTIELDTRCDAYDKFMDLTRSEKRTAATRKKGSTDYTVIKQFAQAQDETTFVTPMQGG